MSFTTTFSEEQLSEYGAEHLDDICSVIGQIDVTTVPLEKIKSKAHFCSHCMVGIVMQKSVKKIKKIIYFISATYLSCNICFSLMVSMYNSFH